MGATSTIKPSIRLIEIVAFRCKQLCHLFVSAWRSTPYSSPFPFWVWQQSHDIRLETFNCLFLNASKQHVSPIQKFKEFVSWSTIICVVQFFLHFHSVQFTEHTCLFWGMILSIAKSFGCWISESVVMFFSFICYKELIQVLTVSQY